MGLPCSHYFPPRVTTVLTSNSIDEFGLLCIHIYRILHYEYTMESFCLVLLNVLVRFTHIVLCCHKSFIFTSV